MTIAGVVVAMAFEARCLGAMNRRPDGLLIQSATSAGTTIVKISGMGHERATRAARELVNAGATSLLSWGTAGALDPSLRAGTVVLATEADTGVSDQASGIDLQRDEAPGSFETRFPTDARWRERLRQSLAPAEMAAANVHAISLWPARARPVTEGTLLSQRNPVATLATKSALFHRSGAVAVDMESAAVAAVAAASGLPFMAVRIIVDTAKDALPAALVSALRAQLDGEQRHTHLTWPLLSAPTQWGEVARLAWRYRAAARALRGCARAVLAAAPRAPAHQPEAIA